MNEIKIAIGVALGALVLGALWFVTREGGAARAGRAIAGAAGDVAAGAVKEAGSWLGIPDTDETECARAIKEGRTWDASFACPAGTFIRSLFGSTPATVPDGGLVETADYLN